MKKLLLIMKSLLLICVFLFSIFGFAQTQAEIDKAIKSWDEIQEKRYEAGQLKEIHGKWQLTSVYMNGRNFYRDKIADHVKEEYKLAEAALEEAMSAEDSKKYRENVNDYLTTLFKMSYDFGPYRVYFQNGVKGEVKFNKNKDEIEIFWLENNNEQYMIWGITQLDKRTLVLTTLTQYTERQVYTYEKII
jgi:hypothetical protein